MFPAVWTPVPAVSWPWVPAWGSLEPPRRDGENAQKTRKNGEEMGEIRPKRCEGRELTKDQLAGAAAARPEHRADLEGAGGADGVVADPERHHEDVRAERRMSGRLRRRHCQTVRANARLTVVD